MIRDDNYIQLEGWMINDLQLKGVDLIVYALIYGFNKATGDWLTAPYEFMSEWTGCTTKTVKRIVLDLIKKGLIERREAKGTRPCSYKITEQNVHPRGEKMSTLDISDLNLRGKIFQSRGEKITTQRGKIFQSRGEKITPNNNNNNIKRDTEVSAPRSKKEAKPKAKRTNGRPRFTKPTIKQVLDYADEKGLSINAVAFYDYYEAKGWTIGKSPMKDWKATVRNWCRREADFKRVTTKKGESNGSKFSEFDRFK